MSQLTDPLWVPSPAQAAQTRISRFQKKIEQAHALQFADYRTLHRWSCDNPAAFWQAVWDDAQLICSTPASSAHRPGAGLRDSTWFAGARLNFAENLLRHRGAQTALISRHEQGRYRTLSRNELHESVRRLAARLREHGIQPGDRIAGFMPNIAETVIAMLATTSIGAVWSSCSPDFGVQGVLDRFGQIAPRLLFCADGYLYNGREIDSLGRVGELLRNVPSLEKVVVVPYRQQTPRADIRQLTANTDGKTDAVFFDDWLAGAPDTPLHFTQLPFDHPLYILYSSGTTGTPKCIVHSAGGVLIQHAKELLLHADMRAEDIFFYYTTCGWMMWNWQISGLMTGATLVLYDGSPFAPNNTSLWDMAAQEQVTAFGTSAKYIAALEKSGATPGSTHNLAALRIIFSTGSPLLHENFDYVYRHIKADLCLASISGGTDIVSCFAGGHPTLPVHRGELQCAGLGMDIDIVDDDGKHLPTGKGELVCRSAFPVMPIFFWNDPHGTAYTDAYFARFPGYWAQGDYGELCPHATHDGLIIHGRSDAVLNPGGVRIGTAEIYRQVEKVAEVLDAIACGQQWEGDERIVLFVVLRNGLSLDETLRQKIRLTIRHNSTPRHVPAKIIQVAEIPRTLSGKIVELAVRNIVHGLPVNNRDALANPQALQYFQNLPELAE